MKIKSLSFLPPAARLLLVICATLASTFLSLEKAATQTQSDTDNTVPYNTPYSEIYTGNDSQPTVNYSDMYVGDSNTHNNTLTVTPLPSTSNNNITLLLSGSNSSMSYLTISNTDGNTYLLNSIGNTYSIKNILSSYTPTKISLNSNVILDLEGTTLVVSSLTLADGTEAPDGNYSFNDRDNTLSPVSADLINVIPSFKLSNGAKLIHGGLIIDSTQPDALSLVEEGTAQNTHDEPPLINGRFVIGNCN